MLDYSGGFYVRYADRYAEVSHQFLQSIYIESSRPKLAGDLDLIEHLKTLVPGKHGYDIFGIDAVKENNVCRIDMSFN